MTTGTERSSVLGGRRKEKARSERVAVKRDLVKTYFSRHVSRNTAIKRQRKQRHFSIGQGKSRPKHEVGSCNCRPRQWCRYEISGDYYPSKITITNCKHEKQFHWQQYCTRQENKRRSRITGYTLPSWLARTGFTPSGAPVQIKMWGPHYMNTPDCLHPTRTVVIIDILLSIRAAMHPTIAAERHTKSFPLFPNHYFNISGLLPCCKKWRKKFLCFLWGPFLWPNILNMTKSASVAGTTDCQ